MIIGHIDYPGTYEPLLKNPAWQEAFSFLKSEAAQKPDGEYEVDGRNIYVPISTLNPQPADKCIFEAHRQYIDVHYCIEGGEVIGWAPVNILTPTMEFDTAKDYCLYESPQECTNITLTPGMFVVCFPEDAHMPKISDGVHTTIKKAVVKIRTNAI